MEIGDISLIHAKKPDALPGADAGAKTKEPQKLKEATEQFEAILIRQYLSEAMQPLFDDSMMGQSSGSHMYQYMITDAMASELSDNSTFGVASLLQMQLTQAESIPPDEPFNSKNNDA